MSNIVHGNGKRSVRADYHPVPCLDLSLDRDRKDALLIHEWMAACGFLHMSSVKRYRSIDRTGQQQCVEELNEGEGLTREQWNRWWGGGGQRLNVHVKPLTHARSNSSISDIGIRFPQQQEQPLSKSPWSRHHRQEWRRSARQFSKSIEITINFWFLGLNSITTYNHHHQNQQHYSTGRLLSYMGGLVKWKMIVALFGI